MKCILFSVLIANALIIIGLSSCKKEDPSPGFTNNSPVTPSSTTTINLVAGRWVKEVNGIYASTFRGIISPANTSNRAVKTYLVINGKETQINYSIFFMGGDLWATNTETDVKINYRSKNQILPFSYLLIKIVIE